MSQLLLRSRARATTDAVARVYGFEGRELEESRSREQGIVQARQTAMWVLHHGLHLSKSEIGRLFHKDRTTVIHSVQQVDRNDGHRQVAAGLAESLLPASTTPPQTVPDEVLRDYLADLDGLITRGLGIHRLLTGGAVPEAPAS